MDELARYNKARWEELAGSNVSNSRPWLDLDENSARKKVDPYGMLKEIAGKQVLCLAGGGGQQSAAFGLLGARVTVFDLSETQLERDHLAAEHYGIQIRTVQGDIRNLAQLNDKAFDIIWQGYSLDFVPDVRPVFAEVARVIRPGGLYYLIFGNPFTHSSVDEEAWDGESYPLKYPYLDGTEVTSLHPDWAHWDVETEDGQWIKVKSPKEFRHTLSTLLNGLVSRGFVILGIWEESSGDPKAEPGSWEHFKSFAPPWLKLWALYRPEVFEPLNHRMAEAITITSARTEDLDADTRASIVQLCIAAHQEEDFKHLFSYLPEDGLHFLAHREGQLVSHAVVTTRWLQPEGLPLLKTAYVDAVATIPAYQGQGYGSALMRQLAEGVGDYAIACLETERSSFYERLGWEVWRGPLAGRSEHGLIPTPDQTGVMILRLPQTPALNLDGGLSIEYQGRIW